MYNSKKFELLQNNFDLKKNSHSYILYTNDFLECKKDLELLIKYLFKNNNLHSLENDYVVVEQTDKKNIQKGDVVELKRIFYNTSYVNDYRIYVIEEVHKLNSTSANMILKFLEEPSENVIAFFITTNLDSVITTIKSRCQIVNVIYDSDITYNVENIKILEDLFKNNKYIALFDAKKNLKKYDRNQLTDLFQNYINYLYNDLCNESMLKLIKKINKCIKMLNSNVNLDYVFDILFLEGDSNEYS